MSIEDVAEAIRSYPGVTRKHAIHKIVDLLPTEAFPQVAAAEGEDAAAIDVGDQYILFAADGIMESLVNTNPYYARNESGDGWIWGQANENAWGIGLHVYGSYNDVTQAADILTNGAYGTGIRLEGTGNVLRTAADALISAEGAEGYGLLVSYGKNHRIEHNGTISAWDNAIGEGTGTFRLKAQVKNPDRKLFPGMYVRVKLRVEPYSKQIMVRSEAILREQLGDFVYVVNRENKVERRKVSLGGKNGEFYAVKEGLKKGERVVISGLQKAQSGSSVTPIMNKEQPPAGAAK